MVEIVNQVIVAWETVFLGIVFPMVLTPVTASREIAHLTTATVEIVAVAFVTVMWVTAVGRVDKVSLFGRHEWIEYVSEVFELVMNEVVW
jgi:hypothetical protein